MKTISIVLSIFLVLPSWTPLFAQVVNVAPVTAEPILPVNAAPLQFSALPPVVPAALSLPSMKGGLALTSLAPSKALAVGGSAAAPAKGAPALRLQGRAAAYASVRDLNGLNASAADDKKAEPGIRSRYDGSASAAASSLVAPQAQSVGFLGSLLGSLFSRFRKPVEPPLQEGHAVLYEVPEARLRYIPDPKDLKGTSDVPAAPGPLKIVGQDRGMEALEFVLDVDGKGRSVIVTGPKGSGRSTAIRQVLAQVAPTKADAPDMVSVRDFEDPENLKVLTVPTAEGVVFVKTLAKAVEALKAAVPGIIDAAEKASEPAALAVNAKTLKEMEALKAKAEAAAVEGVPGVRVTIRRNPKTGAWGVADTRRGKKKLSAAQEEALKARKLAFDKRLNKIIERNHKRLDAVSEQAIQAIKEKTGARFNELTAPLAAYGEGARSYLKEASAFAREHFSGFIQQAPDEDEEEAEKPKGGELAVMLGAARKKMSVAEAFDAEAVVSNAKKAGAPVIEEKFPTYDNIFGAIEERSDADGDDALHVKPGAAFKANGGYLILDGWDAAMEPGVLPELLKALKTGEIEISDERPGTVRMGSSATRSEKVKVDFKLVLKADGELVALLNHYLPEFDELFKGRAQFSSRMDNTPKNFADYIGIIARLVQDGSRNLAQLAPAAVGKVIEFSARAAESQGKLTSQLGEIVDLLTEATYIARREAAQAGADAKAAVVEARHVSSAETKRRERSDLGERMLREYVLKNMFKINTTGTAVGEINALAVSGDYSSFTARENAVRKALGASESAARAREAGPLSASSTHGVVMRVTAVHGASGAGGITWTDDKAGMIGPISTKALAIINGFFLGRYARKVPLKAAISVSFEQEYNGIEGDSASLAKSLAVMSSLSGLPLRQDLAITGSLSQVGDGQIIGGENFKIEGFFELCKARGFTGTQGVVIPETNLDGLQLREDILEAVRAGKFHIYAVRTIDEAAEILFGVRAGSLDAKTKAFPAGTVNRKVQDRLVELAKG